jgi:2',3'-cyclic-nucleotide 2'-phosphodiesterase (5'-nucleotidase family)
VAAAVAPSLKHARDARSRKLGIFLRHPMAPFKRQECPMGNLFADLMKRAVPGADGAFSNGGSLRASLPEGELTYGQMYRAMPFDNQMATVTLTGAELRAIIASNVVQQHHGVLSVSGFRARVTCDAGGPHVSITREDDRAISDDEPLLMVTSDFMALGGDGLLERAGVDLETVTIDPSRKVRDVLIEGLRARDQWDPNDTAIFDAAHPRVQLPGGTLPVTCGRGNASM